MTKEAREMAKRVTARAAEAEAVQNPEIKKATREGFAELFKYLTTPIKRKRYEEALFNNPKVMRTVDYLLGRWEEVEGKENLKVYGLIFKKMTGYKVVRVIPNGTVGFNFFIEPREAGIGIVELRCKATSDGKNMETDLRFTNWFKHCGTVEEKILEEATPKVEIIVKEEEASHE